MVSYTAIVRFATQRSSVVRQRSFPLCHPMPFHLAWEQPRSQDLSLAVQHPSRRHPGLPNTKTLGTKLGRQHFSPQSHASLLSTKWWWALCEDTKNCGVGEYKLPMMKALSATSCDVFANCDMRKVEQSTACFFFFLLFCGFNSESTRICFSLCRHYAGSLLCEGGG